MNLGTICLSIGLGPNWTPFIHYADYINQAEYRYEKLFWGKIKNKDVEEVTPWYYTVPARIDNTLGDCQRIANYAYSQGIWKIQSLGKSYICSCSYRDYFNSAQEFSKSILWSTAKGPPVNILSAESNRINGLINKED